jgi:hypothetical protein
MAGMGFPPGAEFFFFNQQVQAESGLPTSWTVLGLNPGEARFSAPFQTGPGAHTVSCTMSTGSLSQPGRGVNHPPPYSGEVKERTEVYRYSHFGLSWTILG